MAQEKDTKHSNFINCTQVYARDGTTAQVLSTSDPNGYINYWDVSKV